jgi:hypothetical protein
MVKPGKVVGPTFSRDETFEFCHAVGRNDYPAIDALLTDEKVDVNYLDDFHQTALMIAGSSGHHKIVPKLLGCKRL